MLPIKRTVTAAGLSLAFLVVGAGAGNAAVAAPATGSIPVSQCNADPGIDASNDPVHCQYENPLPSTHWWEHRHHHHH